MNPMRILKLPVVAHRLQEIVVAFGLVEEFEQGKFTCPMTGERITWDILEQIKIDGKSVEFYSINARLAGNTVVPIK